MSPSTWTPRPAPVEEKDVGAPKSRRSSGLHGEGRVLVIDDDDSVRRTMARILTRAGYEVITASDGREGVERLRATQGGFDAITLDMCMPGLDGWATFELLRQQDSEVRVVLCSGAADESRIRAVLASGAVCFLPKPFEPSELVHAVALAVGAKEPKDQEELSKTA